MLVENANSGVNAVMRSRTFYPGDKILVYACVFSGILAVAVADLDACTIFVYAAGLLY